MKKRKIIGSICLIMSMFYFIVRPNKINAATDHLLISEVYYDTIGTDSLEEWIEIYNPSENSVDLSNYKIGDEETQGGNEGMYQFPEGTVIKPQNSLVVAKNAIGFYDLYGKYPDTEIDTDDDDVSDFSDTPNMKKYESWSSGSLSFTNTGDEALLLDNNDIVIDAVVFEGGNMSGITPHSGVAVGQSIARIDSTIDTDNCANDFQKVVEPHPGYNWVYEAEDGFSQIGTSIYDKNASNEYYLMAEQDQTTPGYLEYGPYSTEQTSGMYQARFRLKTNNNSIDEPVARIEVFNNGGEGIFEEKEIYGTDFTVNNSWQNFDLWFDRINEGNMEYRVWWFNKASVGVDEIIVSQVDRIIYEAEELMHGTGEKIVEAEASGKAAWQVSPGAEANYAIYGPYDGLARGTYEIKYVVKTNDTSNENLLAILNLNNTFGSDQFKEKLVKNNELATANKYQAFSFGFGRHDSGVLEYRVWFGNNNILTIDNIMIKKVEGVRYEAEDLLANTGRIISENTASGQKARQASIVEDEAGWIQFGPYTSEQKEGNFTATFRLKTNDNSSSEAVAWIGAYNFGGTGVEETRPIWGTDFESTDTWQNFTVDFQRIDEGLMEYRIFFTDQADITVDYVEVKESE